MQLFINLDNYDDDFEASDAEKEDKYDDDFEELDKRDAASERSDSPHSSRHSSRERKSHDPPSDTEEKTAREVSLSVCLSVCPFVHLLLFLIRTGVFIWCQNNCKCIYTYIIIYT